jgi:hypothetical protein
MNYNFRFLPTTPITPDEEVAIEIFGMLPSNGWKITPEVKIDYNFPRNGEIIVDLHEEIFSHVSKKTLVEFSETVVLGKLLPGSYILNTNPQAKNKMMLNVYNGVKISHVGGKISLIFKIVWSEYHINNLPNSLKLVKNQKLIQGTGETREYFQFLEFDVISKGSEVLRLYDKDNVEMLTYWIETL